MSKRSDHTSSEILITFRGNQSYLADRVKQALAPSNYPILTRREKWGFKSSQYLVVIRLVESSGKDGNTLKYDVPRIRTRVEEMPEIRHRNLTDREKEKKLGDAVSEEVLTALKGLL